MFEGVCLRPEHVEKAYSRSLFPCAKLFELFHIFFMLAVKASLSFFHVFKLQDSLSHCKACVDECLSFSRLFEETTILFQCVLKVSFSIV